MHRANNNVEQNFEQCFSAVAVCIIPMNRLGRKEGKKKPSTHSAAETNLSRCPSFSSRTSLVRDSPVDCSPMTMHCGGQKTNKLHGQVYFAALSLLQTALMPPPPKKKRSLQLGSENVPHDKSALLRNTHCVDKSAQDFFALVQHLDHFLVGCFPGFIYSRWG